jgi:hypothetical protein
VAQRKREPGPPMTLGNMRSLGVRGLLVTCEKCRHEARVDVDRFADDVTVPSFARRMVCSKCGSTLIDVRPNWKEQPARPSLTGTMAKLSAERRRALEMLAGAGPHGVTEGLMLTNGFTIEMMVDLINGGLAFAVTESVQAGRDMIPVTKVKITDGGRRALG